MTSGQDASASGNIAHLVGDLVRVLSDQHADRLLVGQCLQQLQGILETLGDGAAATSVHQQLAEAGGLDLNALATSASAQLTEP